MERVERQDFENGFDPLLAEHGRALGIDPVCSTSRWACAAADAFAPEARPRIYQLASGMVALLEHDNPRGPVLTGFDTLWGFSVPLIGPDPDALVTEVVEELLPTIPHHALAVAGVPVQGSLLDALVRQSPAGFTGSADRCVADLSHGFDAWLERRSSRFRRSLRVAATGAEAVSYTHLTLPTTPYV